MSDLKLFQIKDGKAKLKKPEIFSLEKEIQTLCENNLKEILGVSFLKTEHTTGQKHAGRIDTLGIDENNSPVIIEYKRGSNENVINQGLYYLDWLMDHKAEFEMLCMDKLGERVEIDWTNPRLICIANDFTKYDDYAIGQINRNIDLIRYKLFENGLLVFELASSTSQTSNLQETDRKANKTKYIKDYLEESPKTLVSLYEELEEYIFSLGDDIQKKELKHYFAYSRIKNFVCLEIHPSSHKLLVYIKVPVKEIEMNNKKIRDVSNIGHFGTGETELTIEKVEDIEWAKSLVNRSYEVS